MPLTTIVSLNPGTEAGGSGAVKAASSRIDWGVAVSDATATAATTAFQFAPTTYTGSASNLIKVGPDATRCYLVARYTAATTAAVSPVVKVYGVKGTTLATATKIWRIDNSDFSAAGITFAGVEATPSATNMATLTVDSVEYRFSDVAGQEDGGYDCIGADYVIVLVATAATATTGACAVDIGLLN